MRRRPWMWMALIAALALLVLGAGCARDPRGGDDGLNGDDADDDSGAPSDDDAGDDAGDDDLGDLFDAYTPPDQRGPYAVGVTTFYLVDAARFEAWGLRDRALPTEVWYPSTGQGGRTNTIAEMVGPLPDWAPPIFQGVYGDAFDGLWATATTALRDAEIVSGHGRFPVIFFSHGYSAIRFQNYSLCEHLASHGFVVVAPDHYANAVFTNIPGQALVPLNPATVLSSYGDRNEDVAFVYRTLEALDAEPDGAWSGRLALSRYAVAGHSYGGLTALLAGPSLPFVQAIAPLNPVWVGDFPRVFGKPFLLLQSALDGIVGESNEVVKEIFEESASRRRLRINLLDGWHYSATDACLLLPASFRSPATGCDGSMIDTALANQITEAYVTAFFRAVLTGDDRYVPYLGENHWTEDMELTTAWRDKKK